MHVCSTCVPVLRKNTLMNSHLFFIIITYLVIWRCQLGCWFRSKRNILIKNCCAVAGSDPSGYILLFWENKLSLQLFSSASKIECARIYSKFHRFTLQNMYVLQICKSSSIVIAAIRQLLREQVHIMNRLRKKTRDFLQTNQFYIHQLVLLLSNRSSQFNWYNLAI